jgi:hypothetical protein
MAVILADSFDFYNAVTDATQIGPWGGVSGAKVFLSSVVTRFAFGKSLQLQNQNVGGTTSVQKDAWPFGNTSNTVFAAFAHYCSTGGGTANSTAIQFRESSIAQVSICFNGTDQTITVRTGGTAGTIVATFSTAFTSTTWNHFQIKVVFHNTAGEVHIRKNGDTADTFVATGINTRGGTTNAYANGVQLVNFSAQNTTDYHGFDDILLYDNSGSAPNDWVGDIRCYTLQPVANTSQKDFTSNPVPVIVSNTTGTSTARTASTLYLSAAFTPGYDGVLNKVTLKMASAMTGNINVCLYDNTNTSNAGNVLATGTAVNNPATGLFDVTFASPPAVTALTSYRIGVLADSAFTPDGGATNVSWESKASVTYGGGFPTNPASLTTTINTFYCVPTFTPSNYSSVNETGFNGDTSFNYATVSGNEDLYMLPSLPTTPANIVCVQARAAVRKSDTGTRNGQLVVKSGGTTALGASVVQATSYGPLATLYATDPNTGLAWTAAAINVLQAGVKVSA